MPIKGVWCVPYKLASGKTRYYYYTARKGGVRFWQSDEKRVDQRKLPEDFVVAYHEAKSVVKGSSPNSFANAVNNYQKNPQLSKT